MDNFVAFSAPMDKSYELKIQNALLPITIIIIIIIII
jgi:hypothetical protein